MGNSLNLKINLLMIVVVTVFFVLIGTIDYLNESRIRNDELETLLEITSDRLLHTLQIPVWDIDYARIEGPVNAEMQNKNIHTIAVYDLATGSLLVGKTRTASWGVKPFIGNIAETSLQRTGFVVYNEKKLARLTIQMTDRFVRDALYRDAMRQARRVLLLILTLSPVLAFAIFIAVLKPIRMLTETVKAISQGNIDEPIDVKRDDELGALAFDFAVMRDTVRQKIEAQKTEITERKKVEGELRQLRNYLTNIIDSMPSVLIGVDASGTVTQWNKRAEMITGIHADAAHGKQVALIFPDVAAEMPLIEASIRAREPRYHKRTKPLPENRFRQEEMTIYPLIANGVDGAVIRIDDISEKARIEELMIQSEKMLSVGGLAAGMAHEINNPLAGMMQTANVIAGRMGDEGIPANIKAAETAGLSLDGLRKYMELRDIPRMLASLSESGQRVADIVANMLSFARKGGAEASPNDICSLVDKTLDLAATDYDLKNQYDFKQILIIKDYEPNLPEIVCESAKIQQVFLNILRNGAQAMQDAATIEPMFRIKVYAEPDRDMLTVDIEDNGPGMTEAVRRRVFEPFFTTKPVGIGTGLGLSVSYFIITENHGGEMTVESAPESGARFLIRLPVHSGEDEE